MVEHLGWAIYCVIPIISVVGLIGACICGGRDCPVQKCFSILMYCCMWYYIIFGATRLDYWWYGSRFHKIHNACFILIVLIWIIQMVESFFSNVKYYFTEMGSRSEFNETLEEVRSTNPIITFHIRNYYKYILHIHYIMHNML